MRQIIEDPVVESIKSLLDRLVPFEMLGSAHSNAVTRDCLGEGASQICIGECLSYMSSRPPGLRALIRSGNRISFAVNSSTYLQAKPFQSVFPH